MEEDADEKVMQSFHGSHECHRENTLTKHLAYKLGLLNYSEGNFLIACSLNNSSEVSCGTDCGK